MAKFASSGFQTVSRERAKIGCSFVAPANSTPVCVAGSAGVLPARRPGCGTRPVHWTSGEGGHRNSGQIASLTSRPSRVSRMRSWWSRSKPRATYLRSGSPTSVVQFESRALKEFCACDPFQHPQAKDEHLRARSAGERSSDSATGDCPPCTRCGVGRDAAMVGLAPPVHIAGRAGSDSVIGLPSPVHFVVPAAVPGSREVRDLVVLPTRGSQGVPGGFQHASLQSPRPAARVGRAAGVPSRWSLFRRSVRRSTDGRASERARRAGRPASLPATRRARRRSGPTTPERRRSVPEDRCGGCRRRGGRVPESAVCHPETTGFPD